MGLIEKLRQYDAAKVLIEEQVRVQQEARQAAIDKEKTQRTDAERERHAKRREQAENFRKESEVSKVVDELAEYLRSREPYMDREEVSYTPTDPDSVADKIKWDHETSWGVEVRSQGYGINGTYTTLYDVEWRNQKSIAVETCPDGTIVFHAGRGASSKIRLKEWRSSKKDQLFEKALEKAYRNPGVTSLKLDANPRGYKG